jgi:transcriptional regulator with PAS, ATPase and Fis domain
MRKLSENSPLYWAIRNTLIESLTKHKGKKVSTAKELEVSRPTLRRWIKMFKIKTLP